MKNQLGENPGASGREKLKRSFLIVVATMTGILVVMRLRGGQASLNTGDEPNEDSANYAPER
jgi:hypothetical protein